MCLASRLNKYPRKTGIGWKVFFKSENGKLHTGLCNKYKYIFEENIWTEDANQESIFGSGGVGLYSPGFHICLNRQDAYKIKIRLMRKHGTNNLVVKQVKFRDIQEHGIVKWFSYSSHSFNSETIVAKQCKILPE